MANKKMIFHIPFEPKKNRASASQIRPFKMKSAFESLGYQVSTVMGTAKERKSQIKEIKREIKSGEKYELFYSESSTMPTLLTEDHHFPLNPFLDFGFFGFCKKYGIKIGVFYRDIYWMFPEYKKLIPIHEYLIAKFFYKYDLYQYEKLVSKVYLPSMNMARFIPILSKEKFDALPPGHAFSKVLECKKSDEQLNLLYVGGIGPQYQMQELFVALSELPWVTFTLCTRKEDWNISKHEYLNPLPANIKIVHKQGKELVPLYDNTDIALLFVKPQEYREFAAPVKLYEYMGLNKPIIATRGTLSGKFVEESDIGWTIKYDKTVLKELLEDLHQNRALLESKARNCVNIKQDHTWEARAEKVIKDLTS